MRGMTFSLCYYMNFTLLVFSITKLKLGNFSFFESSKTDLWDTNFPFFFRNRKSLLVHQGPSGTAKEFWVNIYGINGYNDSGISEVQHTSMENKRGGNENRLAFTRHFRAMFSFSQKMCKIKNPEPDGEINW